jgi:hypothetical protein
VVAHGTPEQVAAEADTSYTGRFLAKIVNPAARPEARRGAGEGAGSGLSEDGRPP